MGRKQLWDQDAVLASAMQLFRRRGYFGASLRDIEEATGLHPGSLYRTFQSKDGLFHAALDTYNERIVQGRIRLYLLESDDPLAGIRSFFNSAIETGAEPDPGCLLTNTAIESFALPQSAPGVHHGLAAIEGGLADALTRARRHGDTPQDLDIPTTAAHLLALYQGLLVLVRAGLPRTTLHSVTDGAMASIGSLRTSRKQNHHE
ncbi:TetR/AcrR family transcriptional regulator [Streptomyces xanthochromogenes]|uniref:TetR/AcrR family transcriptional regulator n=1 Tax=Streptomyces xanthochromogenes TaxID=67384 RepID=UPI0037F846C2